MNHRARALAATALLTLVALIPAGLGAIARQPAAPTAPAEPVAGPANRIGAIALTVTDLDRSMEWYRSVLDAEPLGIRTLEGEAFERLTGVFGARARAASLRIGSETIELFEFITPRGRPIPHDSHGNDRWFQHIAIIVRDMDEAYARLKAHNVAHASPQPQRLPDWNTNAGGIEAFYFRDPDGHYLEILEFPNGKGEQRWQSNDRLFLGIDHTAIVVDDTEASLAFYRDLLGLRVAGTSENHGPEQERLNAVFPARLRITTLRAPTGPGIELLEYLTPRSGRPMPADTQPTDVWHWHVAINIDNVEPLFVACRKAGGRPVSPGPQPVLANGERAGSGLMARDPDGHALLFLTGQ